MPLATGVGHAKVGGRGGGGGEKWGIVGGGGGGMGERGGEWRWREEKKGMPMGGRMSRHRERGGGGGEGERGEDWRMMVWVMVNGS